MSIEWDGKGLPPVGAKVIVDVCACPDHPLLKDLNGKEVEVIFHSEINSGEICAVFRWNPDRRGYLFHGLVSGNFKPIKSERDKAIEDCIDIFNAGGANDELLR